MHVPRTEFSGFEKKVWERFDKLEDSITDLSKNTIDAREAETIRGRIVQIDDKVNGVKLHFTEAVGQLRVEIAESVGKLNTSLATQIAEYSTAQDAKLDKHAEQNQQRFEKMNWNVARLVGVSTVVLGILMLLLGR